MKLMALIVLSFAMSLPVSAFSFDEDGPGSTLMELLAPAVSTAQIVNCHVGFWGQDDCEVAERVKFGILGVIISAAVPESLPFSGTTALSMITLRDKEAAEQIIQDELNEYYLSNSISVTLGSFIKIYKEVNPSVSSDLEIINSLQEQLNK